MNAMDMRERIRSVWLKLATTAEGLPEKRSAGCDILDLLCDAALSLDLALHKDFGMPPDQPMISLMERWTDWKDFLKTNAWSALSDDLPNLKQLSNDAGMVAQSSFLGNAAIKTAVAQEIISRPLSWFVSFAPSQFRPYLEVRRALFRSWEGEVPSEESKERENLDSWAFDDSSKARVRRVIAARDFLIHRYAPPEGSVRERTGAENFRLCHFMDKRWTLILLSEDCIEVQGALVGAFAASV